MRDDGRIRGAKADRIEIDDHVVFDRAERRTRCAKHECSTVNGLAYCIRCGADESQILDDMADDSDGPHVGATNELTAHAKHVRDVFDEGPAAHHLAQRPARIPTDVWDTLTIREAIEHGLVSYLPIMPADEGKLVRDTPQDRFLAEDIHRRVGILGDDDLVLRLIAIRTARRQAFAKEVQALETRDELVDIAKREIRIAAKMGASTSDLQKALTRAMGRAHPQKQLDVCNVVQLREDICPNDRALFPSYTFDVPNGGRVLVSMHGVVNILRNGADVPRLIVDIADEDSSSKHRVTFSMLLDDPHTINASKYSGEMRRTLARDILVFDRAVRFGEEDAVGAYGLILFALAWCAGPGREQARAAISKADEAMNAVMQTARKLSEEQ